jgi:hypothetical protein
MKAIANYDEGLQKHPAAFDLAYNKYVHKFQSEEPWWGLCLIANISLSFL